METRCPNCQQPLLSGDTACWQCGWQLAEPVPAAADATVLSAPPARAQVPALWIYAALTAFLVIMAGILLHQLGKQPLVQVSAGGRMPADWQRVTTHGRTLTLDLPPGWTWLDQEDPSQADAFAALLARRQGLLSLTYPLGRQDPNAALIFAAAPAAVIDLAAEPVTLVVIRSPVLSRLSAEAALATVAEADVELVDGRQVPNYDKTHTSFLLEMDVAGVGRVRCRQQFFHDEPDSLLLAVCGHPQQFRFYAQQVEEILATVQRLHPQAFHHRPPS